MTKNTKNTAAHVWMPETFRVLDATYGALTVARINSGEHIGDWMVIAGSSGKSEIVSEYSAYWTWKNCPAA